MFSTSILSGSTSLAQTSFALAFRNAFFGKNIVATGKLVNYTREGIQSKLYSIGATPASSVTRSTDYLIVGEKAGSKLAKAQQFGVKTLTEAEFESMLNSGTPKTSVAGEMLKAMIRNMEAQK